LANVDVLKLRVEPMQTGLFELGVGVPGGDDTVTETVVTALGHPFTVTVNE
jgi:hypothetical protein